MAGQPAALVFAEHEGQAKVTHTRQIEIETELALAARRAAMDYGGALSAETLSVAIDSSGLLRAGDRTHAALQASAVHLLGSGPALSVLTGVAGAGKTSLLRPLVAAYREDRRFSPNGRDVIGVAVAWRQAEALRATGIQETYALEPLLGALASEQLRPSRNTVVVIDEVSQVPLPAMLTLLKVQAATGLTLKALGDPEQCQAIGAGDTVELLRRVLPPEHMPEILTTVRQRRQRERLVAGLFREGRAADALRIKREDGTARLVGGEYDQDVDEIAELFLRRRDALAASQRPGDDPVVTVSALTNADARNISKAIRLRLRERGEITGEEVICPAVDGRGTVSELPIAAGDELRLFRRVHGRASDGTTRLVGCNGDFVQGVLVRAEGLRLRSRAGRVADVEWWRLADPTGQGLMLGPGYCLTVDAAQGMTATEHINALPRGSAGATAFKTYVAESRHTEPPYPIISEAAVREAELAARPIGEDQPVSHEELWRRVADDMSAKPRKALATDLLRNLQAAVVRGEIAKRRIEAEAAKWSALSARRSAARSEVATHVERVERMTGLTLEALERLSVEAARAGLLAKPARRPANLDGTANELMSRPSSPVPS